MQQQLSPVEGDVLVGKDRNRAALFILIISHPPTHNKSRGDGALHQSRFCTTDVAMTAQICSRKWRLGYLLRGESVRNEPQNQGKLCDYDTPRRGTCAVRARCGRRSRAPQYSGPVVTTSNLSEIIQEIGRSLRESPSNGRLIRLPAVCLPRQRRAHCPPDTGPR